MLAVSIMIIVKIELTIYFILSFNIYRTTLYPLKENKFYFLYFLYII